MQSQKCTTMETGCSRMVQMLKVFLEDGTDLTMVGLSLSKLTPKKLKEREEPSSEDALDSMLLLNSTCMSML